MSQPTPSMISSTAAAAVRGAGIATGWRVPRLVLGGFQDSVPSQGSIRVRTALDASKTRRFSSDCCSSCRFHIIFRHGRRSHLFLILIVQQQRRRRRRRGDGKLQIRVHFHQVHQRQKNHHKTVLNPQTCCRRRLARRLMFAACVAGSWRTGRSGWKWRRTAS